MKEPRWILDGLARGIHRRQLAEHGGKDGIRDAGMLDSALARPKQHWAYAYPKPDVPALAAAYAFSLAIDRPFISGNAGTALALCRTFLLLNGCDIDASQQEEKYVTFLGLAEGRVSEDALAKWIRSHLRAT